MDTLGVEEALGESEAVNGGVEVGVGRREKEAPELPEPPARLPLRMALSVEETDCVEEALEESVPSEVGDTLADPPMLDAVGCRDAVGDTVPGGRLPLGQVEGDAVRETQAVGDSVGALEGVKGGV